MNKLQQTIRNLLEHGVERTDRTGVGTLAQFGHIDRWDLEVGHPHENAKYTPFKINVAELLWIISGSTRLKFLKGHNCHVWDEWVKPGTEVWGREYSYKERLEIFKRKCEEGKIQKEAVDQYVDIWMEMHPNAVMDAEANELMMENFKIHTHELLDGELGPVYGQQWRSIIDTRRVTLSEVEGYVKRGYRLVGVLEEPGNPLRTTGQGRRGRGRRMARTATRIKSSGKVAIVERKIDQLQNVIDQLINKPDDRGIIVNAWHVPDLDQMALRPCHTLFQFDTERRPWDEVLSDITESEHWDEWDERIQGKSSLKKEADDWIEARNGRGFRSPDFYEFIYEFAENKQIPTRKLSCLLYQRSQDSYLGRPFNITQYALLTRMVAQVVNMHPGEFILVNGNLHLYKSHIEPAKKFLEQDGTRPLPWVNINPDVKRIEDFKVEDFEIVNYAGNHGPKIGAPVAV